MKKLLPLLFISFLSLFEFSYISAQDYILYPEKDNSIFSEGPYSNGKGEYLFAGFTVHGPQRRALIKFSLHSLAPDDSVVSATLTLYMSKTIADNRTVYIHRILNDWGEGSSDALYEEGAGADATPGSATWNDAFFDSVAWEVAGGDYVTDASDSTEVGQVGSYTWNGDGLVTDLNDWLEDSTLNHGWLLCTDSSTVSAKRFNSRENLSNPPMLEIQTVKKTPVGISIHGPIPRIKMYPNPSKGQFILEGPANNQSIKISIYSISGKLIKNMEIPAPDALKFKQSITLEKKGIYIIEINNSWHKKITIF